MSQENSLKSHSKPLGGDVVVPLNGAQEVIHFDAFLDCIGDGFSIQDRNYKIIYQNNAHKEIVGDHLGEFCYRAYSFQEKVCDNCPVALVFQDGERHTIERTTYPPEGVRHVEITASPLRNAAGEIIAAIELVRNIGVRKQIEEQLRKSEERFREIFAHAPVGMAIADQWGRFLDANASYCRLLGYEKQELLKLNFKEVTHPEDANGNMEQFQHLLAGEMPAYFLEKRYRRKDGRVIWVRLSATTLRHIEGSRQVIALVENIDDRKRAEEALRTSEERFRMIADFTYDWEYWIDPDGNFIYVSPSCEKITGYRPEDFKCDPDLLVLLVHPDDRRLFAEHLQEYLRESDRVEELEFRITGRHGRQRWIAHACRPVYGRDGQYMGRRASNRDITERKQAEEELQKAQRLESIGILAGGIAHDFNNSLTAIMGNIEIAKMFLDPEDKAFKRISIAEQASMRARGIAQQLLTFSKGGAPIKKTHSVPRLVQEALELGLPGSNLKCEYSFPADLRAVAVDENQISQVLNNLAINAGQAMPQGGVLRISARNEIMGRENAYDVREGNYVRIDITDEGIGIPKKYLEKIFDPYFTTKQSGSGLGLAISYSIIKRHGGTITVHSVPGEGSTFSIFLPASEKKEVAPGAGTPEGARSGSGTILLMDDDETVREIGANLLQYLGYHVQTAEDGGAAVAAYEQALKNGEPFTAVITDLTVPGGMGGQETARRLLEMDPRARVVVSSGYANDRIMSDYKKYGFQGVIPKPYKLEELGRTLREVLGGKPG